MNNVRLPVGVLICTVDSPGTFETVLSGRLARFLNLIGVGYSYHVCYPGLGCVGWRGMQMGSRVRSDRRGKISGAVVGGLLKFCCALCWC